MSRPKRARSLHEKLDDVQIKRPKVQEPLQSTQQTLQATSYPPPTGVMKTFTISTRTACNPYSDINGMLNHIHILRHGDPEAGCGRWENQSQQQQNETYDAVNAVLRDAFLQRHRAPPSP
ncbi:hypothetical protein DFQ28_005863 [Apophysomyces sp. BC1034]|nr:hypothetical protein DFQ29_006410 [Apophysomyces sp. BC1021]KAG0193246.1 hypothetical protein DFQ28_005863 [Apophysomyces sp. BC1034]